MDFAYKSYVILSAFLLHTCIGQNSPIAFTMEVTPAGSNQKFAVNSNRVLMCTASATEDSQKPTLRWTKDDTPITATSASDRIRIESPADGSIWLRLNQIKDTDNGLYKCEAVLGSQTDSRSLTIEVIQELQILSPKDQHGNFGEDGIIKCEATAIPLPTFTMKHGNGSIIHNSPKYIIQSNQMIIKNLNDADTGSYLCDIIVMSTGENRPFYIDFLVVRLPKIDTGLFISPNNPKVGDQKMTITCHATGFPQPTYEFYKSGNVLSGVNVDAINGIYTINDVKQADESDYSCKAINIGGSDVQNVRVDVKVPPTIEPIDDITDAVEGGQERVTCTAYGDPVPTVIWQKQGLPAYTDGIKDSGLEIISVDGNNREDAEIKTMGKVMNFASITPQDVGVYTCIAFNVVGNATKVVKFEVKYKPNFDTDYQEKVFFGWKGHTANLTCLVSANEIALIQWNEQIDNRTARIENIPPFTLPSLQQFTQFYLSSSSLMVYVSDENSPVFKDYICEATNTMGKASRTVTLARATSPGAPTVEVTSKLSTKVTLKVQAPTQTGGLQVTGYHFSYSPAGDTVNIVDKDIDSTLGSTIVELKDLKPNTDYLVRSSARNAVGLSTAIPTSFQTMDVSKPVTLNIVSPAEGSEPTTYTVQWDEPDDGGSPITQYIVKCRQVQVQGGPDPTQWVISGDIDPSYMIQKSYDPNARSYTLKGLVANANYDIRVSAVNKEGESPEAFKLIRTSQGGKSQTGKGTNGGPATVTVNVTSTFLLLILACLSAFW